MFETNKSVNLMFAPVLSVCDITSNHTMNKVQAPYRMCTARTYVFNVLYVWRMSCTNNAVIATLQGVPENIRHSDVFSS